MSTKIIILTGLIAVLLVIPAFSDMGIGIIAGEPTGISFRMGNFPILGVAWSFQEFIHIHADFWFLDFIVYEPFEMYIGAGAKVRVYVTENRVTENQNTPVSLGIRIPAGAQYFPIPDVELFLEICPGILLFPRTTLCIDVGIGVRYIFSK